MRAPQEIEKEIKNRIQQLGLVKTGSLLNSISVTQNNDGGYNINANDYFVYLDEEYDITNYVFSLQSVLDAIADDVEEQFLKDLGDIFNS
jgi:hypothetical protein